MPREPENSGTFMVAPVSQVVVAAEELEAALGRMIEHAAPHTSERIRRIRALALGLLDELNELNPDPSRSPVRYTGTDEEPLR